MCTHQLNEVQDFTQMCAKLFSLEDTIQTQRHVLSSLEYDLQRELNPMSTNMSQQQQQQHNTCMSPVPMLETTTPETAELRKEVALSREQTRLQCKQLHDLDAKMRSNEHNLMMREQQLQQLLEELYIQEIYADNAFEKALTNTNPGTDQGYNRYNNLTVGGATTPTSFGIPNGFNQELYSPDLDDQTVLATVGTAADDGVELKIINNRDDNAMMGINYLNSQHKSLSYGNLHHPCMQNTNLNNHDELTQLRSSHTIHTKNSRSKYSLKASPSLDLNSSKLVSANNQMVKHSNMVNNVGGDHSGGDNDSGISSMSSETTSAGMQQQQQQKTMLRNPTPTNLHMINGGNVTIPIAMNNNHQYQNQYQMMSQPPQSRTNFSYSNHQQNGVYAQEQFQNQFSNKQAAAAAAAAAKSVLETLV